MRINLNDETDITHQPEVEEHQSIIRKARPDHKFANATVLEEVQEMRGVYEVWTPFMSPDGFFGFMSVSPDGSIVEVDYITAPEYFF